MLTFLAKVEEHKSTIIKVGVCLFLAYTVIYSVTYFKDQKEKNASAALLALRVDRSADEKEASSGAEFLAIADDFAGTKAAPRAVLLAAGQYFKKGKYAESQSAYQRFQADFPGHPLSDSAALGLAATVEAQGKTSDALSSYKNLLTQFSDSHIAGQAELAVARINEAQGKLEDAFSTYEKLADPTTDSRWSFVARSSRDRLLKDHPELEKVEEPEPATLTTNTFNTALTPPASSPKIEINTNSSTEAEGDKEASSEEDSGQQ